VVDQPAVTAIVVAYNDEADLAELLPGIVDPSVEVLVVDNASADGSAAVARAAGATVIAAPSNVGWSAGGNLGARQARGDVLAFVNPDARPTAADLRRLARLLDAPDVGLSAPRFVEPSGEPQPFYFRFPTPWTGLFCFFGTAARVDQLLGRRHMSRRTYTFGRELPTEVDQPGAACVLVRAADFARYGGFDEQMFLFFSDTELCRRLADDGLRVAVDWQLDVVHRGGGSVGKLADVDRQHLLRADYLRYARRRFGPGGRAFTWSAYVGFGLVAVAARLLRGQPAAARRTLTLMRAGLRRDRRGRPA
jgi:GT2 family glycosyltransferase